MDVTRRPRPRRRPSGRPGPLPDRAGRAASAGEGALPGRRRDRRGPAAPPDGRGGRQPRADRPDGPLDPARRVRGAPAAHRLHLHVALRPTRARAVRGLHVVHQPGGRAVLPALPRHHLRGALPGAVRGEPSATATSWAGTCRGTRRSRPSTRSSSARPARCTSSATCGTAIGSSRRTGRPAAAWRRWTSATRSGTSPCSVARSRGRTPPPGGRSRGRSTAPTHGRRASHRPVVTPRRRPLRRPGHDAAFVGLERATSSSRRLSRWKEPACRRSSSPTASPTSTPGSSTRPSAWDAMGGLGGTNVVDHVAHDGSKLVAVSTDVADVDALMAALASPPPEVVEAMQRHGVLPPLTAYVQG